MGRGLTARITARMPVRNTPSNVPAPPIEAARHVGSDELAQIHQVGADQRAQTAGDIGQRRRVIARQQHGYDRRNDRRDEDRHGNPDSRHWLCQHVYDAGQDRHADQGRAINLVLDHQVERQNRGNHCAADVDRQLRGRRGNDPRQVRQTPAIADHLGRHDLVARHFGDGNVVVRTHERQKKNRVSRAAADAEFFGGVGQDADLQDRDQHQEQQSQQQKQHHGRWQRVKAGRVHGQNPAKRKTT